MKKSALSVVILSFSGFSTHVFAQNSVTLYGLIDAGMQYTHNSGGQSSQISMTSGNLSGSRWGLKGSEDLGGGLTTVFTLESGFNVETGKSGQGTRLFGRQAFVGLQDSRFGTLTAGRQYDPLTDIVQPIQGDNFLGGMFSTPGDVDNADNTARFNSAVKWASPSWAGLKTEWMYTFGGIAGSQGSGQTWSGAVSYGQGPLGLAAGFMHIDNGNTVLSTRGTTTADSLFTTSVNDAYSSARSINIARLGGNYAIGSVTLGGYYSFAQYVPDASSSFTTAQKYNTGSVYALWQLSPSLTTEIGYTYMKSSGDSSAKYNQFALGADYVISKRTDFYAVGGYGHASGENGEGTAQAVIGSTEIDSGKSSQAILMIGMRHRF
ncbi:MAG TPA: porin [Paraburkholderia sp.]|uniref:porin n=1 Tax=Paraburkholderia sp. TaxID=1926495 RepID=UPI002B49B183|nr:porin [Paraburkholderia sp.]HKR38832.1 porin [Paraburkholderia sp.]